MNRFLIMKQRRCKDKNEELYPNLRPFCERYWFDDLPEELELLNDGNMHDDNMYDIQDVLESMFCDDLCEHVFKIYSPERVKLFHTNEVGL